MSTRLLDRGDVVLKIDKMEKSDSILMPLNSYNIDRTNKGIDFIDGMNFEPITLVNLLGVDGNFEKDSNSDGLADGWTTSGTDTTTLSTSSVFGLKAQSFTKTNTTGVAVYSWVDKYVEAIAGHVYFMSFFAKKNTGHSTQADRMDIAEYQDTTIIASNLVTINLSDTYKKFYQTITANTGVNRLRFFGLNIQTSINGQIANVTQDGGLLVDLTNMGNLPTALKKYFNNLYTTWASLAGVSSITAIDGRVQSGDAWLAELLPFVNSVQTLGYSWDGGELTTRIENRGENLIKNNIKFNGNISSSYPNTDWAYGDLTPVGTYSFSESVYKFFFYTTTTARDLAFEEIKVKPNTAYTLNFNALKYYGITINIFYFNKAKKYTYVVSSVISTLGNKNINFTTTSDTYYIIIAISNSTVNAYIDLSNIILYEGTDAKTYTPAKTDYLSFTDVGISQFGVSDEYFVENGQLKKIKRWNNIQINGILFNSYIYLSDYVGFKRVYIQTNNTDTSSIRNQIGIKYNGKLISIIPGEPSTGDIGDFATDGKLYLSIFDTDSGWLEAWTSGTSFTGDMTWEGLIKAYFNGWKLTTANTNVASCTWTGITSGTTKTGASGYADVQANVDVGYTPYQLFYQLATPIVETIAWKDTMSIYKDDNYIISSNYIREEAKGNGSSTIYALGTTATDTNYKVFINGKEQLTGVTKTTSNFTFATAPYAGSLIAVEYNAVSNAMITGTLNVLEPVGSPSTIHFKKALSVSSEPKENKVFYKNGNSKLNKEYETYSISFTKEFAQDDQDVISLYKDKIVQITIEHIADGRKEVYAPCIMEGAKTIDYLGEEAISMTFKATNMYEEA